jgi:hypothetical protein
MKRSPRNTASLSDSVRHHLNLYAIAAGAAGVSALALSRPAKAEIVYTPTHTIIGRNHRVFLDLNNDGQHDFVFKEALAVTSSRSVSHFLGLEVRLTHGGNRVRGDGHFASALPAGIRIGGGSSLWDGVAVLANNYYGTRTGGSGRCIGPWVNIKNHYLGFKFGSPAAVHFGWARLTVTCTASGTNHQIRGLLTGYAYETIAGKPIVSGKTKGPDDAEPTAVNTHTPATLGVLALGAPALPIWRREEAIAAIEGK